MGLIEHLVYIRNNRFLYPFINAILLLLQIEIPKTVTIGKNLRLQHRAMGTVIHPLTKIGDNVTIYNGVTVGAAIPWNGGLRAENGYSPKLNGGGIVLTYNKMRYCALDAKSCARTR